MNMTDEIAISIKNLTKTYQLYNSHADRVKETFHPFRKKYYHPFNALTNVSFDVQKGESVGIIGLNGSGKSTLLQVICGILQPSSGSVTVNGRVSALLDFGAGFNPEFTGRQNVFLNGSILGIGPGEMRESFDEIASFADIGEFIDQPLKTYSSGMLVRLGFAVATNVDPDVLLIDEALAVGDAPFQMKCFQRLREFQKTHKTIVYVSHDIGAVQQICHQAVLLNHGRIIAIGDPEEVTKEYAQIIRFSTNENARVASEKGSVKRLSTGEMEITECQFNDSPQQQAPDLTYGDQVHLTMKVRFNRDVERPIAGVQVKTINGFHVAGTNNLYQRYDLPPHLKGDVAEYECSFPILFTPNDYCISLGVGYEGENGITRADLLDGVFIFKVLSRHAASFGLVELGTKIIERERNLHKDQLNKTLKRNR